MLEYEGGELPPPSPGVAAFNDDAIVQPTINPAQLHDCPITSTGQVEGTRPTPDAYDMHLPEDPECEALRKAYDKVSSQNVDLRREIETLQAQLDTFSANQMGLWRKNHDKSVKRLQMVQEEHLRPLVRDELRGVSYDYLGK